MKVAFLSTSSLDYPSPLGRWFPLAKELVRRGHTVHFLTLHHDFRPEMRIPRQEEGVWVHEVGQMHVRGWGDARRPLAGLPLFRVAMTATLALLWRALQVEVDAYHICKPQPMNGLAGLLAARWKGRPCYLDCDDYEAEANRLSSRWQWVLLRFFEDGLPPQMNGVTVNSRFLADRVARLGVRRERIVYVPNGVERVRFARRVPDAGRLLRERYGLIGRPVVLYLGTLNLASHPLDLLLEAFARVLQRMPEARLVLVGGGEDRPILERQVEDQGLRGQVLFVGAVSPAQVPDYLALGDLAVDPVRDDAVARARSPLKVFESMACGLPVVTGDVGDRREILGDEQAGLLVSPGDPHALAEGIMVLLSNPIRRQEMAEAGRKRAEQYMWDRLVERFLGVYQGGRG